MFRKKTFFLVHLEFFDNRHRCKRVVNAKGETCMFITIYLGISCPNFIISSFTFQVKIQLHVNCLHVDLVDLVTLVYMFIRCQLLNGKKIILQFILNSFYNRNRPMIILKESTFVIKHLGYKILKFIKVDPYVHPN